MQKQFLKYCKKIGLESQTKILVTVSGGLDSVALLHLFCKSDYLVEVAHCNFNLRGDESDGDEQFVKELCTSLNITFHSSHFDTHNYSIANGVSIQMAARDLRYAWFEELRIERELDFIATAHHQDDQVETVLLNLSRGTGLKGMHGILSVQNQLIRPLLFTDRMSLEKWMYLEKLSYREDSSNASEKYSRNKLRHKVLPILKEINPSLTPTFQENTERFNSSEQNLAFLYENQRENLIVEKGRDIHLLLAELKKYPSPIDVVFHFISKYGFNDWVAIESLLNSSSGKMISSHTHHLLKDRDELVVKSIKQSSNKSFAVAATTSNISNPLELSFNSINASEFELEKCSHIAALDFDKLTFPLELRKWQKGDFFYPLGMKGKKKLSDFFIDKKLSLFEKENTWLLCSNKHIVWVVGHRIDDSYKLVENSQKVYLVQLNKK